MHVTMAGHKETKQKIGTLRLPVEEIVRNAKIRDSWALQVPPRLHQPAPYYNAI